MKRPCFTSCSRRTYSEVAMAWKPSRPENMSISEMAMRCGWLSCSPLFSVTMPERLQYRVHGGAAGHRPGLPKAGDRVVNDPWLARADGVVAEAVALDCAGTEALDEDIGAVGQSPQDLLALRRFQVDREAALAQRAVQRIGRVVLVGAAKDARPVAAVMRGLDLDHIGAVL